MIDEALFTEIVGIRRDLHRNPEIGFDVERTAGIVADYLKQLGVAVKTGVGKTGVVGDLEVPGAVNRIAFRADMDALPIQEERESPYRSDFPGKAHLCGHDAHTAMLLGATKMLVSKKEELKSHVRFIFQPSEESRPGGAPGMIRDGCLEGVNSIYALHVWPWFDSGQIGVCPGPVMAQSDTFSIQIEGKGGHAAAPHFNRDPIIAGSNLITMLQSIVSRMVEPRDSAVISVTQFHAGTTHNVTPSVAELAGTVRTYTEEALHTVKTEMHKMVEHCGLAYGVDITLDYLDGYPATINDRRACDQVSRAGEKFLQKEQVIYPSQSTMLGEDFAYYLQQVPGCFIQLGCRNENKECVYPLHHPKFDLDEECMKVGSELFCQLAFEDFK